MTLWATFLAGLCLAGISAATPQRSVTGDELLADGYKLGPDVNVLAEIGQETFVGWWVRSRAQMEQSFVANCTFTSLKTRRPRAFTVLKNFPDPAVILSSPLNPERVKLAEPRESFFSLQFSRLMRSDSGDFFCRIHSAAGGFVQLWRLRVFNRHSLGGIDMGARSFYGPPSTRAFDIFIAQQAARKPTRKWIRQ